MWIVMWKTRGWCRGIAIGALMVASGAAIVASEPVVPELRTLEHLLRHAVEASPGLAALAARVDASRENEAGARALPDPGISASVALQQVETRVGPQYGRLSVRQTLPWAGKRDARGDVAEAESERALERHRAARFVLEADVTTAYVELHRRSRAIEITRDNRDLVVYLEGVVRKAYENGAATYADLIRIQVEIGRLENDLRSLEDGRRPARAALNALLHRRPDAPLPDPVLPEPPSPLLPEDLIRARTVEFAPALREREAGFAVNDRAVVAADLLRRPDWTVSVDWIPTGPALDPSTPGSGSDAWLVGVMVDLPFGAAKYDAAARAARARRSEAAFAREAVTDDLGRRVEELLYEVRNADREMRLYRDTLVPKARQSLAASDTGFRAGTVSVSDLVEAQQVLLQFELAHEDARADRAAAVARLRATVGDEVVDVVTGTTVEEGLP